MTDRNSKTSPSSKSPAAKSGDRSAEAGLFRKRPQKTADKKRVADKSKSEQSGAHRQKSEQRDERKRNYQSSKRVAGKAEGGQERRGDQSQRPFKKGPFKNKNEQKKPYKNQQEKIEPPKEVDSRALALHMMRHVLDKGQSFDQTQQYYRDELAQLSERDRGFVRTMLLNSFRYLGQFDKLIAEYLESEVHKDHGWVQYFLRLGMVQLLILETPPHAAIGELLRLIDKDKDFRGAKKFKGLINAILGRVIREGRADFDQQNFVTDNLPDWIYKSWVAEYGEEITTEMANANLNPAPIDVYFEDSVTQTEIDDAGLDGIMLPGGGVRVAAGFDLKELDETLAGRWWVQDLASALPLKYAENILDGFEGKSVFDLCAAPGGKTMQLAAKGAKVTAVDISKKRLQRLEENLERLNLDAEIVVSDVRKWEPDAKPDFVFLDAPCSATGTMRRHPDLAHVKRESDIEQLSKTQQQLLIHSLALLQRGGVMVYAVCSLQPEEAEAQIRWLLSEGAEENDLDIRLIPISADMIDGVEECVTTEGFLRCRPDIRADIGGMDGFFAAFLQRQ